MDRLINDSGADYSPDSVRIRAQGLSIYKWSEWQK